MSALGLIETTSLPAMIEACDAATKAASVRIVAIERIGCALQTCFIRGDVAAVLAAVEAGSAAAARIGHLVGQHVIPRPHAALSSVFPVDGPLPEQGRGTENVCCSC
ncbi:MAG: BMC domain-containing protein [Candidatus Riflebacteria bacterium]|nr:BMC domain-containing protein [Candidatus Riflebacteria bacterium]